MRYPRCRDGVKWTGNAAGARRRVERGAVVMVVGAHAGVSCPGRVMGVDPFEWLLDLGGGGGERTVVFRGKLFYSAVSARFCL